MDFVLQTKLFFAQFALMKNCYIAFCFFTLIIFATCGNKDAVDISNIKVDLQPVRFDKEFAALDTNNLQTDLKKLYNKHTWFTNLFTEYLTGWGKYNDTALAVQNGARHFLTYKDYINLQKTVSEKFSNTSKIDAEISTLIKHVKYYDKAYKTPKLYYFVSGLNLYSAITYDTLIGIGLDMFLGKDYPFYPSVQMPQYQINLCEPKYIPIKMASAIYQEKHEFNPAGKNLLALIIERGKEIYYLSKVLPQTPIADLLGYNEAQYAWMKKNEGLCWNFFITQQLLYANEFQKVVPYVTEGPSAPGLPMESPGSVGSYIGFEMVSKYAAKQKNLSLLKLINKQEDPQNFLQDSGYKPN